MTTSGANARSSFASRGTYLRASDQLPRGYGHWCISHAAEYASYSVPRVLELKKTACESHLPPAADLPFVIE